MSASTAGDKQVAFVTGSSVGIGIEPALALARKGYLTCPAMRNRGKCSSIQSIADKAPLPIKAVQLDVTDETSVTRKIIPKNNNTPMKFLRRKTTVRVV